MSIIQSRYSTPLSQTVFGPVQMTDEAKRKVIRFSVTQPGNQTALQSELLKMQEEKYQGSQSSQKSQHGVDSAEVERLKAEIDDLKSEVSVLRRRTNKYVDTHPLTAMGTYAVL